MTKPIILYFIRSEADLERITSIAIPGQSYAKQYFCYYGDIGFYFDFDIKNKFQKYLFQFYEFEVIDIITLSFIGRLCKYIEKTHIKNIRIKAALDYLTKVLKIMMVRYINKDSLAKKILKKINPDFLITDNSEERLNYFPHHLRQSAIQNNIKIHITGHGPAGSLHKEYHSYNPLEPYKFNNCTVGICSKHDYGYGMNNRIITGDPADGFPHLILKNALSFDEINFLNERKFKIGFFMAAPFETCTNGWSVMEEIMLEHSFNKEIAMVAKFHPRLYNLGDYRYLEKIDNLKLFGSELDRSRLVKWADILVCSDHCSTIFEPMILGKKVVAVNSKKVRPFKTYLSKIYNSNTSLNRINNSSEFKLDKLKKYTSDNKFIDEYCWGGHGKIDLGEKIIRDLLKSHD